MSSSELIAVLISDGQAALVEAEYLLYVLNLSARGIAPEAVRPGVGDVNEHNAAAYTAWMVAKYAADPRELVEEIQSLRLEGEDQLVDQLPCIVIDFDCRRFSSSFWDEWAVNFESYVPSGWTFEHVDSVLHLVPERLRYWSALEVSAGQ